MNAPVQCLLARLEGVRQTGPNSWRADCPNDHAHARGSLAITEADDGRVLLHDFAGCEAAAIVHAVGLELGVLFPERIREPSPEARRAARAAFKRSAWSAALRTLSREATVVLLAAQDLKNKKQITDQDHRRLEAAADRIENARAVLT